MDDWKCKGRVGGVEDKVWYTIPSTGALGVRHRVQYHYLKRVREILQHSAFVLHEMK